MLWSVIQSLCFSQGLKAASALSLARPGLCRCHRSACQEWSRVSNTRQHCPCSGASPHCSPPWGHLMSPILKECIWLNWVPVAKIPKIGTIISVGLQGDENKLTRMKSAQKISHTKNNYTMFSETKGPCIITRNNLMDLAISAAVPASIFSYESDKSILFWK